jgi:hypothetical protein
MGLKTGLFDGVLLFKLLFKLKFNKLLLILKGLKVFLIGISFMLLFC